MPQGPRSNLLQGAVFAAALLSSATEAHAAPPAAFTLPDTVRAQIYDLAKTLPKKRRAPWTARTLRIVASWARSPEGAETIVNALERSFVKGPPTRPAVVGVTLLIDVSGSMGKLPRDRVGPTKIVGAQRAARAALARLKRFAAAHPSQELLASVLTFSQTVHTLIPLTRMGSTFPPLPTLHVESSTAIGLGLLTARAQLNHAGLGRQHIIVITDGQNSSGPRPEVALRAFNLLPQAQFPRVHFIAFDIGQSVFRPLSLFLSKIYEAKNDRQLDAILAGLFSRNILPEAGR